MELIIPLLLGVGLLAAVLGGSDSDDPAVEPPIEPPVEPPVGTAGDDIVTLTGAADIFDGGIGDDSIDGGAGFETLLGGAGEDMIEGDFGKDSIDGGSDNDTLYGGAWNDSIDGNQGFDDIFGGAGNDQIQGGFGKDLIDGGAGNDRINGGDWDDGLFGGDGADTLFGGNGDDILIADEAYVPNNTDPNSDTLYGGNGDDYLSGGKGADTLFGGAGDDILAGAPQINPDVTMADYMAGRNDPDFAIDEATFENRTFLGETDVVDGGAGDDLLIMANRTQATGGDGMDTFALGDWLAGSQESTADILDFEPSEDVIVIALAEGNENADVRVEFNPRDSGRIIFLDGLQIATVKGNFNGFEDIESAIITTSYVPVP